MSLASIAMPVLGIDFGSRRLGLAISDEEERIALPIDPVVSQGSKKDLVTLIALMQARAVNRVVVGLPISMDGSRGAQAEAVERFAERLRKDAAIPVDLLDERLTSVEAERALEATGRRGRKKKKAVIDSVAAAVLLRTYLEQRQGRSS